MAIPPYRLPPEAERGGPGPTFISVVTIEQPIVCRVRELITLDPDQDYTVVSGLTRKMADK